MKSKSFGKLDIIVVIAIVAIAVLMIAFMSMFKANGKNVEITVDGKVYKTVSLSKNSSIEINNTNVLVIKDGYAFMKSANCPDKICVKHKKISKVDDTIVCLPNKVVVTVVNVDQDDISYGAW